MKDSTTRFGFAITLIGMAMIAFAGGLRAQQTRGPLTIFNNTTCYVAICDASGLTCVRVPPGTGSTTILCNTTAIAVRTCGNDVLIPLGGCAQNVAVEGCCADVCFSPGIVGCTFIVTVNPAAGPCPCP